jgi:hypothetical protein
VSQRAISSPINLIWRRAGMSFAASLIKDVKASASPIVVNNPC